VTILKFEPENRCDFRCVRAFDLLADDTFEGPAPWQRPLEFFAFLELVLGKKRHAVVAAQQLAEEFLALKQRGSYGHRKPLQ